MAAREGLILVARAAGAFGVKGDLRITSFTADPASLLGYGALLNESGQVVLTLIGGRGADGGLIARAHEVATREQAQALRGLRLYIERSALPPPETDEYYLADLIGLRAVSPTDTPMGWVKAVNNFGAGDLLEIMPADGSPSWWAPFTLAVVPDIRLSDGVIVINRPIEVEAKPDET